MPEAPQSGQATFNFKAAITHMVQRNASDLLLKVGRPATIRVTGELVALESAPLKPEELKSLAEQIMTPRQVKEFAEHKEADFAIGVPGVGRFRTNVYQQRGTVAFAFRAIPYEVKTIRDLNLPPVLEEIGLRPRGLVLVTGVTGSGKSTALAAMINHINTSRRVNIITIEDPIEFLHRDNLANISQREVGNDTLSFNAALRHVLRQAPDVILIGEIRDMETLDTALKAADTGHLVFSTLHTTDATQTINRVISFFPPHQHDEVRHLLSTALQAIVSLRLVPRKDGKGRVPASEVLINTAAVQENMRDLTKSLSIPDLIAQGSVQYGMQSFDQSLFHWYQQGMVSYESAIFYATNPSEFALKVSGVDSGEIALRVIRACKELGIEAVAVYSEADRECLHTRFADDDVCIGRAPARDSYLNIPRIIAAAEITGADALHPGYGFLAENAEFADIVRTSNITFVGPTGEQIRQMGDKAAARKLAQRLKVPTVPGSPGPVEDAETGLKLAEKLGFPVIIKAAAGGGGKGMRVAQDGEQFPQAFSLAKQEALAAFGSDEVYLEKYLARPRHIEIQIMGDTHGRIMHLCERDCSVQRRHQKLVEEAPSPAVDATLRQDIGDSAVRLAEAIGYVGAGTIEFLLDEDGSFYFMEMNTRIQVEHPVTEMCTNFDLVKEQIRVAAGEPLSFVMNGNRLRGHAIECRVNAEDPARNFQPSPGTITAYHPPGGPGVRVDTHIYAGYTVPPFYDSLLAKVIVHGNSRAEALARMRQALDSFIIEGVTTTIPFLSRVMRHPDFVAGRVDTKFLEREPQLLQPPA